MAGDVSQFNEIFDVIELWHTHGDHYVREAATIGLLEQLQNGYQWPNPDAADYSLFEQWLRPETERCWLEVIGFWGKLYADR